MAETSNFFRPLGETGIRVPAISFRADALDDSQRALPEGTKRLVFGEWLSRVEPPVLIEASLSEQHESQVQALGRMLAHFDVAPDEVVLNLRLECHDDSRHVAGPDAIHARIDRACELLGKRYTPRLLTLHVSSDDEAAAARWRALFDSLKQRQPPVAVGIALDGARINVPLVEAGRFDFIRLTNGPTVLRHPPELQQRLAELAARSVPLIAAGVFHGGFLVGGPNFDGRAIDAAAATDQMLFTWRKAFAALCHGHGVRPAHACIQFALRAPGVVAVSVTTSSVQRVAENVYAARTPAPDSLWASMREEGLLG